MSDPNTLPAEEQSKLELLYNVSVSDLAFFKQQQWTVTNHCLVILAGLVGIAQLLATRASLAQSDRWLLTVLAAATVAIGLFVLGRLHHSIGVRRKRLENVREKFGHVFEKAWYVPKRKDHIVHFLVFIQIIAALLTSWLLVCRL